MLPWPRLGGMLRCAPICGRVIALNGYSEIFKNMAPVALVIVLFALLVLFLRQQKAQTRRTVAHRDVPREELLPRHYKSFTAIENELWHATNSLPDGRAWDGVRFGLQQHEFEMLNDYLHGLRDDYQKGRHILGQVIAHSPEMELFAQLEWERCRIQASFCFSYALARFRLRTAGVSVKELRGLTEIVASLSNRVRKILTALESSGNLDLVESILKNS
jgi:hypothetical protein